MKSAQSETDAAADLVAYLDGELPPDLRQKLESRLSHDGAQRQALRQLQQAWDLLDDLPRAEADDTFTQSTVEVVASSVADTTARPKPLRERGWQLRWPLAAAITVSAAVAGFLVCWDAAGRNNRRLLAELPLAELPLAEHQELTHTPLQPADADAILQWLDEFVERHETEILNALPPPAANRIGPIHRPETRRMMLLGAYWRLWPTGQVPQPTADDLQELVQRLSPAAQAAIEDVKRPQDRTMLTRRWIGAALSSRVRPLVSAEDLRRFFARELTSDERAYLESLPQEEMRQELMQIYVRSRRGPGEPRNWGPPGMPRPRRMMPNEDASLPPGS